MRDVLYKKGMVISIICLFIGAGVVPSIRGDVFSLSSNTLYVGGSGAGNYTTIQSAIDAASGGDTIYVFNGIYYENLNIDKGNLNLIGENKYNTIIDGNQIGSVIIIDTHYTLINNLTIRCSDSILDNNAGILIKGYRNIIKENIIYDNQIGISIKHDGCHFNDILYNQIVDNKIGVFCRGDNTEIMINNISNNEIGVFIEGGIANQIFNNNFYNNDAHGYFEDILFWIIVEEYVDNKWNNNYWEIPREVPYKISGLFNLSPWGNEFALWFSFFRFDWNPSLDPFLT